MLSKCCQAALIKRRAWATTLKTDTVRSAAFTLTELLIVMVILATLSVIALTSWRGAVLRAELAGTTLALLAFVQTRQSEANWRNQHQTLALGEDSSQWCFMVLLSDDDDIDCQKATHKLIQPYTSVSISQFTQNKRLTFYGRHGMAQTGTITLSNSQGRSKIIISVRGRIRYCSERIPLSGMPLC